MHVHHAYTQRENANAIWLFDSRVGYKSLEPAGKENC